MEPIDYFKVSGSGNDFLALAEPAEDPTAEQIRAWCRRGVSLGADGLFVLRRRGAGVAMDYFNADGLAADLCLNGTRCAVRLALHLGWCADRVTVETPAGAFRGRAAGPGRIAIDLTFLPIAPRLLQVEIERERFDGWFVQVGVPHYVLLWPEGLAEAPVATLGAALRRHDAFAAAGTNVDFVRFPTRGLMEIRTYERGVEAETLSCGTGVLAGAATGLALGGGTAGLPLAVLTAGGFALEVDAAPRAEPFAPGARWTLTGDARLLARGELLPEAVRGPAPPAWTGAP
ncbi:MAG TPA: diaminopimelate epimerase [Thermoanaerobaculia bacterium]|nr:diaminopimelate epimerase [Thermoanaerobaculia bacterium]